MRIAKFGKFKFDLERKTLKKAKKEIDLTEAESAILNMLAVNAGGIVGYEDLVRSYKNSYNKGADEADLATRIYRLFSKKMVEGRQYLNTYRDQGYKLIATVTDEISEKPDRESEKDKLLRFFGKEIVGKRVKMIFAYRWLDGEIRQMKCNLTKNRISELTSHKGEIPTPEGVLYWIPQEDIRSCVYAVNLISQYFTVEGFSFLNDDHTDPTSSSVVFSFGLFNCYTIDLTDLCDKNLFQVEYKYSPKNKTHYTDNISVNGKVVKPDKGRDIAVIARIVTHPSPKVNRVRFIIAGRTATGTAVAGYYFAENWSSLLELYDNDKTKDLTKDSLAVVISHRSVEKDTESIDESGKVHFFEDGKPMIIWARHGEE